MSRNATVPVATPRPGRWHFVMAGYGALVTIKTSKAGPVL